MRVLDSGGAGMGRNSNHAGTESVLPVLAVGDETSCLEYQVVNSFQELADLGIVSHTAFSGVMKTP